MLPYMQHGMQNDIPFRIKVVALMCTQKISSSEEKNLVLIT